MANLDTVLKRIEQLEKLEEENKISRDMLKGELENNDSYLESVEEVKALVQKRKQIKDEILASGPNQEILANIKNNQEEVVTLREILSAELMQLYSENQTDEIAGRKFKINAKLLPKKSAYEKRNGLGQYDSGE